MSHFINNLLELKDPNIKFDPTYCENREYKGSLAKFFRATLRVEVSHCPKMTSGSENCQIVKNGSKVSVIKLIKVAGRRTYLELKKQRYYCKSCHTWFTAPTSIVEQHCHISRRLKTFIMDQASEIVPNKKIAKDNDVSPNTVQRMINKASEGLLQRPKDALAKRLCFDEFKSVKNVDSQMSFIMIDADSHRLVDLVSDRRQHHLINYFLRYALKDRQKVEAVTMDMYTPYMNVVKRVFPNAKIIIDRFHIVQALNRELNRSRVQIMNSIRTKDRKQYNKLKRYWRLILAKRDNLTCNTYKSFPLFPWLTHTQGIVDYLLATNETLKSTYEVVHQLSEALRDNDWEGFKEGLSAIKTPTLAPGLKRVLRTFRKLQPYIKNTFDHPNLTNGPIEGINNKIKVLKRQAYGYRNLYNFKNRILLTTKLYYPTVSEK